MDDADRTWPDAEAAWQRVDPVLVRGMQRSGTSVTARAIRAMGARSFGEGHLWFEVFRPMEIVLDDAAMTALRADAMAMGAGRARRWAAYLALAADRFHRDHLPGPMWRWMDKSPGLRPITVLPVMAQVFPAAQVVFVVRDGISVVESGCRKWSEDEHVFERLCDEWARTMAAWRTIRGTLAIDVLELPQGLMAREPRKAAQRLTTFLGRPDRCDVVAELFGTKRVLTSFPDRPAGEYGQPVRWSERRKEQFRATCGSEMSRWGFAVDFEHPGRPTDGPRPTLATEHGEG